MIGMAYAARHPERIARLVVLNTAAFHLPEVEAVPLAALALPRTRRSAPGWSAGCNAFCRDRRPGRLQAARRCRRDVRDAYLAPYDSWANRIAVLRFVQDIPLRPGDRALRHRHRASPDRLAPLRATSRC